MKSTPPLALLLGIVFTSCLTVGSKEYRIHLKDGTSGEAVLRFINIVSESDDTTDLSANDFHELVNVYLEGKKFEEENLGYSNVTKRLYEEDGVLIGEISFSFDSLASLHLFQYDEDSPYMYMIGGPFSSEQLVSSNGSLLREWMPVIFWPRDTREFHFTTKVVSEVSHQRSLLPHYRQWLAQKKPGK